MMLGSRSVVPNLGVITPAEVNQLFYEGNKEPNKQDNKHGPETVSMWDMTKDRLIT